MARKTQPPIPPENEVLIQRPMEEIMHDSMIPYSEHVILERALPRVEDGLKPVQRRILFTMHELGLTPDKPHRKCARIVGDCLGKYHPHGDSSVYDALARMAQDFSLRQTLVDGHGNFGSMDGDGPAAMRYTEARMQPLALDMLRDIEKDTVNFSLNFDDTQKEPDVLPGRFPNLLVNGASGIAVGLATNIPPHNPAEVIDGVVAQIDNPDITTDALMGYIPAPDFPTGGILLRDAELRTAYETGRAKLQLRARVHIEDGSAGRRLIVITEIPYQVPKAGMLENKQNVFDDFIAAAEYLIAGKYTSTDKLAIHGGSNGGLLVGACEVQRPDLYAVCLPAVGVMDMLRYHKFTIGWGWAVEYGSSENEEQFSYIYKYSPLHNIKEDVKYPATLVTTADHDDRVVPAHSFKFAAAMQHAQAGDAPILIRIESKAGHGAGKPTSKRIDEAADMYAFLFQNIGVPYREIEN